MRSVAVAEDPQEAALFAFSDRFPSLMAREVWVAVAELVLEALKETWLLARMLQCHEQDAGWARLVPEALKGIPLLARMR